MGEAAAAATRASSPPLSTSAAPLWELPWEPARWAVGCHVLHVRVTLANGTQLNHHPDHVFSLDGTRPPLPGRWQWLMRQDFLVPTTAACHGVWLALVAVVAASLTRPRPGEGW